MNEYKVTLYELMRLNDDTGDKHIKLLKISEDRIRELTVTVTAKSAHEAMSKAAANFIEVLSLYIGEQDNIKQYVCRLNIVEVKEL
jgi:hypothetical protein